MSCICNYTFLFHKHIHMTRDVFNRHRQDRDINEAGLHHGDDRGHDLKDATPGWPLLESRAIRVDLFGATSEWCPDSFSVYSFIVGPQLRVGLVLAQGSVLCGNVRFPGCCSSPLFLFCFLCEPKIGELRLTSEWVQSCETGPYWPP